MPCLATAAAGRTDDQYGWEIDQSSPSPKAAVDELANLQPLQWQNNRRKGEDDPNWTCAVT